MKKIKKFLGVALLVGIVGLILWAVIVYPTGKTEYQAAPTVEAEVEEPTNIEDREDVKKRIELAKKQIVLEAQRADEVKRHEDEMARLESELDTVRTAQVSL